MRLAAKLVAMVAAGGLASAPLHARADEVLDWNTIMVTTVSTQNPFAQGRIATIAQLAVFEAVNAITGLYEPYLGTIAAPPDASPGAAAVAAAHRVLAHYVPAAAGTLEVQRMLSLAAIPDGPAENSGITVGEAAAAAMIAARALDGSSPPAFFTPSSPDAGEWQPTIGCPPAGGLLFHWGRVTPFGLKSAGQFRAVPPPDLASSRYTRSYNEVRQVGGAASSVRPQDRTDVARFYNAVLAVATWNPAVRQAAAARSLSLAENARAFALINMAISDGLVAVMESKYHYTFWRPETAIPAGELDGNKRTPGDAAFVPLIGTPCFPSYPSAHATASYAARGIAERLFGDGLQDITLTNPALPGMVLEYSDFEEITADIDDARVYGGIHFRFDQRAGARQGRQIAAWTFRHHLRPVAAPDQ